VPSIIYIQHNEHCLFIGLTNGSSSVVKCEINESKSVNQSSLVKKLGAPIELDLCLKPSDLAFVTNQIPDEYAKGDSSAIIKKSQNHAIIKLEYQPLPSSTPALLMFEFILSCTFKHVNLETIEVPVIICVKK
jgi:hypothetical protein